MKAIKVLVIEDEILISETIRLYLTERGHIYLAGAISYDEGIRLFHELKPDLILLDVRLYGCKSGIDIANYISTLPIKVPYVFLTSQFDKKILEEALKTVPAGYLTKPIRKETLWTTIESAYYNHQKTDRQTHLLNISDGNRTHVINEYDIMYIQAEHIYITIYCKNDKSIILRLTMYQILEQLTSGCFIQCHRSYIVNCYFVNSWNNSELFIKGKTIPISRTKKSETIKFLKKR